MSYSRQDLIKICEKAIVDVSKWDDRDTPITQQQVGIVWALLKANCIFEIEKVDAGTIWLYIYAPSFRHYDCGEDFDINNKDQLDKEYFYLPTLERLKANKNQDWY
jgi:hypothetical protein